MELFEINLLKQQYEALSEEQQTVLDVITLHFTGVIKSQAVTYFVQGLLPGFTGKDAERTMKQLCDEQLLTLKNGYYDADLNLKLLLFHKAVANEKYREIIHLSLKENVYSWVYTFEHAIKFFLYESFGFKNNFGNNNHQSLLPTSGVSINFWRTIIKMPEYDSVFMSFPEIYGKVLNLFRIENIYYFSESEHIMRFYRRNPLFTGVSNQTSVHQAEIKLHAGDLEGLEARLQGISNKGSILLKAQAELYRGNHDSSIALFEEARRTSSDGTKIPRTELDTYNEFLFWLNYLFRPDCVNLKKVDVFIRKAEKQYRDQFDILLPLALIIKKEVTRAEESFYSLGLDIAEHPNIFTFICLMISYIVNRKLIPEMESAAGICYSALNNNKQWLLMREINYIMQQSGMPIPQVENLPESVEKLPPTLMERLPFQEKWELMLDGLLNAVTQYDGGKENKTTKTTRICYLVDFENKQIQPVLQTSQANGQWSGGRNIALKTFKGMTGEPMTDQDRLVASAVEQSSYYYGNQIYYIDYRKALPGLCGHPLLFLMSNPQIPVELVKDRPEIITENTPKGIKVSTNVSADAYQDNIVIKETQTRYKFLFLTPQQQSVVRMLDDGLIVPLKGKDKLLTTISQLSNLMTVHSDMAVSSELVETIIADSRIRVQIIPMGNGLKAELFVKPLSSEPPYVKPGKGSKVIHGIIDGKNIQATRDLSKERSNAVMIANGITLDIEADLLGEALFFDDPYHCLALLEVVEQNPAIAIAEWPEGESFRLKKPGLSSNFNLRIKGSGQWFDIDGELNVDEGTVVSLRELLRLSRESKGRFIEIENGLFLALTAELKKQIDELESISVTNKERVSVNMFAAHALEGITADAASVKSDKSWKEFQKRLQKASVVETTLHPAFVGELRPYQEEGFRWMARLHYWNAGACLADDMGLGKTIQTIAMMLEVADKGPSLVVCPASVLPNWGGELRKFAPALNVVTLKAGGNREEIFNSLQPFDVLVITYGLLHTESSRVASRQWAMAVLDEAHAIKNANAKSSKSAMNIQADFKLALTGTPVQNHLGELWNLFNFCNPGLLGTLQQFTSRFVNNDSPAQRSRLKKLIAPFILRRTKNNVLEELPSKTEITYRVTPGSEETAFYEALRMEAVSNIENNSGNAGQQHIQALAEITKLRLACCNAKLVNDALDLPSAKLEAFLEIVKELMSGNHRALVFSQFVRHLSIVRAELDKLGITYQYLDGSLTLPERETAVKEFQAGKSDLFLISLKAGGLGLNLTSADYVLHLDPWWNPAIEDQASDRSHRIGQQRPVTIYRLVAAGTIEEKIVKLHATKRDMANSLLDGTDKSAKLSTNDLLNLIKEM